MCLHCRDAPNDACLCRVSSATLTDAFHAIYFTTAAVFPTAASMAVSLILASRWSSCDGLELEFDRSPTAQPHRAHYILLILLTCGSVVWSPIEVAILLL